MTNHFNYVIVENRYGNLEICKQYIRGEDFFYENIGWQDITQEEYFEIMQSLITQIQEAYFNKNSKKKFFIYS